MTNAREGWLTREQVELAAQVYRELCGDPGRSSFADGLERMALAALEQEWRPIETAPKDHTWILVWCEHGQYVVGWNDEDGIGWWVVDDNKHGPYMLRGSAPTHWFPLPTPPREA